MDQSLLREVLVARQPILAADFGVAGYELLSRDVGAAAPASPSSEDGIRATAAVVIDGLFGLGLDEITGGDDAWVNVPVDMVVSEAMRDLPPQGLVLEVLDDGRRDQRLPDALRRHREAGFQLAFDGVVPGDARLQLLDLVDVVKVDLPASGLTEGLQLIRELAGAGCRVVAEKVEDPQIFERASAAGAELFQGFFFTRPLAVRGMRPSGVAIGHLQLLDELAKAEVDLVEVEHLIRTDVTLSDRFLRLVQARSGGRHVESIHHGLVLLGVQAVQRWVNLLVLSATLRDQPGEVAAIASARARGCELLEQARAGNRKLEAFSLGMFSVFGPDGHLTSPTLDGLPVTHDVRAALEQGSGPLRPLLDVMIAAERGDWDVVVGIGRELGAAPKELAAICAEALGWSTAVKRATTALA